MARISLYHPGASINEKRYAYCLCLHVKPATIFVALVNLGGSLLCTIMSLYILSNGIKNSSFIPNHDGSPIYGTNLMLYPLLSLISAMLLYGVVKSKPSYILPFFAVQFIDYLFTIPHFLANIYTQPMHRYYMGKAREHLMEQDLMAETTSKSTLNGDENGSNMIGYSSDTVSTSIMLALMVILVKTYFLCVVWKCYRYLHMKDFILPFTVNAASINTESAMAPIVVAHSIGSMPPPNYEEATNMSDSKPPEYDLAIQISNIVAEPNNATDGTTNPTQNNGSTNQMDQTKCKSN